MKILVVTEDLPVPILGGAGKHAVLLANTLIEAGHHVEMLGRQRESDTDTANGFQGKLHTSINLQGTGWKEQTLGAFVPMRRHHLARRVWQAIEELGLDWDVIHYHGHFPAVGALVPKHINFVHTLHDQGSECITRIRFKDGKPCSETDPTACAQCATSNPNVFQKALSSLAVRHHRRLAKKAFTKHKALFVSEFLANRFAAVTKTKNNLAGNVVHNFVDVSQLRRSVSNQPEPKSRPRVFMAGRIDATKGFGTFLDLLPNTVLTKCEVVVAGDGPQLQLLRSNHENRGVIFLGWQTLDEVLRLTASADLCVLPSIWEEPCGTTVLEALALGRPVFALRLGGTPDLARYQTYPGQLRLFNDLNALADALTEIHFCPPINKPNTLSDVRSRLPEIIALYRQQRAGRTACSTQ